MQVDTYKKITNFPIYLEIHIHMDAVKSLASAQRIMKFRLFSCILWEERL